jgi:hypothetical protein
MWTPLSNVIVTMISQSVSCATMRSLLHGQHSKWIPKSLMVWTHWHCERCETIGCGISKRIRNVVRKWMKDKQNEGVLGWANNQALVARPTQEQRCAHIISKRKFAKSELNSYLCNWSQ